jgi:hypothetical protein
MAAYWFGQAGSVQNKIMQDAFQEALTTGVPLEYSRMEKYVAQWLRSRGYFNPKGIANDAKARSAIDGGDFDKFWKIGSNEKQRVLLHQWVDNAKTKAAEIANDRATGGVTDVTMQDIVGGGDIVNNSLIENDKLLTYLIMGVVVIALVMLAFKMFKRTKKGE